MIHFHLAIAVVATLALCALVAGGARVDAFEPSAAIVGGARASYARYPYLCSMRTRGGGGACTGVLIDPRTVMTAGHCQVAAGNDVVIGGDEVRRIAKHEPHIFMDIALLRLDRPSTKRPIRMASAPPKPGSGVTALGVGKNRVGEPNPTTVHPPAKLVATLADKAQALRWIAADKAMSLADRSALSLFLRSNVTLAVVARDKGLCSGDSGGPLIVDRGDASKDELIGINSMGNVDALCRKGGSNRYALFASVPYYRQTWAATNTLTVAKGRCGAFREAVPYAGGRFVCPRSHPWYSGVGEGWGAMQPPSASGGIERQQCATTQQCAQTMRSLHVLRGGTPVTAVVKQ